MDTSSLPRSSTRRARVLFGGSIIFVGLAALLFWAMSRPGSTAFYLTPTELQAKGATPVGETYRLNGTVVPGSITTSGLTTSFTVTDGDADIEVTTDSPVPDTFKDKAEVVARGGYDGSKFTAVEVLAKCPSKFKAKA